MPDSNACIKASNGHNFLQTSFAEGLWLNVGRLDPDYDQKGYFCGHF